MQNEGIFNVQLNSMKLLVQMGKNRICIHSVFVVVAAVALPALAAADPKEFELPDSMNPNWVENCWREQKG